MVRKKQKKVVGIVPFVIMVILFTIVSLITLYFFKNKADEVIEKDNLLKIEQQKNEEIELQLQETQQQNEQMFKQIEELKEEIKKLQLEVARKKDNKEQNIVKERVAYLTFDDGPSDNTVAILDFLKKNHIPATFFVVGNVNRPDVYKRIIDEGHTIGNHTYGHDYNKIYKSADTFLADVDKLNDLLEEATGQRSTILRFPGGSNNTVSRHAGGNGIMKTITAKVKEEGYRYFDWNVDSQDASKAVQDKNVIVRSVVSGAQYTNQAVILMHDAPAKTTTVDALPEIVEGLKKLGFVFKPLTMDTPEVQFQ